jgi:protein phosphatase
MSPPDAENEPAIQIATATHIGLVRQSMQDVALAERVCDGYATLIAVTDGIGGAPAGEIASDVAARTLVETLAMSRSDALDEMAATMEDVVRRVNEAVVTAATEHAAYAGMGTTLTAVVIAGAVATIGHVGDSRAYLLRDGTLQQLTRDHTQAQEAFGCNSLGLPGRNVLTRAIGVQPEVRADTSTCDVRPGDRLLVATDGLHDVVESSRIAEVFAEPELDAALIALIDSALAAGGPDNIALAGASIGSPMGDSARGGPD